jgi:hypothetical protein
MKSGGMTTSRNPICVNMNMWSENKDDDTEKEDEKETKNGKEGKS